MNYNGINCPVCSAKFGEDADVVVCPVCGTPHHRICWNGCVNEAKHKEGFVWQLINIDPQPVRPQPEQAMKVCPRCGEKNASYEPVCIRCGERLKGAQSEQNGQPYQPINGFPPRGDYQTAPNPNNFSPYQNVYAQDARTVFGDDAKIEDISVTEVAEYVQKDSSKYIGKFLNMQENKTKFSWNWSAALGSVFWCFYRKMMGVGFACIAIFFSIFYLSSMVVPVIFSHVNPEVYAEYEEIVSELSDQLTVMADSNYAYTQEDMAGYYETLAKLAMTPVNLAAYLIQIATILIINVVLGFFGNHFYKKKVLKDIRTIRQVSVDSMSYHMYLRQRGNVSVANLLMPILSYMFFTMITTFI